MKRNDFFIGFTISVLLSIFVNSAILMHKAFDPNNQYQHFVSFENFFLFFALIWFFVLPMVLFLVNYEVYRLGERWFHHIEYKSILLSIVVSCAISMGALRCYPAVYTSLLENFGPENVKEYLEQPPQIKNGFPPHHHMFPHERHEQNRLFPKPMPPFMHPLFMEHLIILLTVILSVSLIRLLKGKQQMELEMEQLKTEKIQTSYNALMGQINPHFLFNSLNGLNSLIQNDEKERTLTYLGELSNVFRYILQSNNKETVTLAEELEFVKAYTYLLGVRYEGKLFFSIQADQKLLLWYLPILSILPLIENAVKHNTISKQSPLRIDIYTTADNELIVSNHIQPKIEEDSKGGLGLKNLWGRYRLLTGKDIAISNRNEYFKVTLPLLNAPVKK